MQVYGEILFGRPGPDVFRRTASIALIGLILQVFAGFGSTVSLPVQAAGLETEAPPAAADPRPCHEVAPASTTPLEEGDAASSGSCLHCCLLGICCAALPTVQLAKDARLASTLRRSIATAQPALAHSRPRFRPPILTHL